MLFLIADAVGSESVLWSVICSVLFSTQCDC